MDTKIDLEKLKEPISPQWRVQSANNGKAICIPYIDARDVQERLDSVCGPENWQDRHTENKGNIYCEIGIFINDKWIWKSDVGTESKTEKEKGEASDSFKRAGVMWGIGRNLYKMNPVVLPSKKDTKGNWKAATKETGEIIYSGFVLTKYINERILPGNGKEQPTTTPNPQAKVFEEYDKALNELKAIFTKEEVIKYTRKASWDIPTVEKLLVKLKSIANQKLDVDASN